MGQLHVRRQECCDEAALAMALANLVATSADRPCDAAGGGFRWSCLIMPWGERPRLRSGPLPMLCRADRGLLGGAGYHRAAGALLVVYNRDIPVVTAETLARLGARITAHSGAGGSSTLRWKTSAGAAREHVCRPKWSGLSEHRRRLARRSTAVGRTRSHPSAVMEGLLRTSGFWSKLACRLWISDVRF